MTAPELDSLRLLVLVGELGSIGQAAAVLGLAQPSASKRLSFMERRLGLVLMDRTRRGSALTPDGRAIAGWARRVLTELDGLLDGAQALRTRHEAGLRVAASMTLAEHLLPGWIGELNRANPGLYLGLQVTNSDQVAVLAREGKVDLGFVESPGALPGLVSRKVAGDHLVVVVSGTHPWARARRPLTPAELATTPLVVREQGSGTRKTVDAALREAGVGPVKPLLELGSASAVRNAVLAGAGPAVISALDVTGHDLVVVAVEGVHFGRVLRAVWPAGRRLDGPAAELLALATRKPS
ncbi:DNA-binding transcriptional regulator, LysR family [Amycolatopsis lurida]|uniref:LysR family transcriptional regulator n=1 Tax=Amycolatopsis lurida NRRL 2430 TaxID=1460371 RepID=A0A2P2FPW6_AMYLU|nr:LysR family transcriptional regulator [Amycolatopsis lurida]KFU78747.1 LysR family transcriptional regulator [Amycolatopsis lurida NRRL 2430]SEB31952.1 DNA-binding transcriptional regulator, LysR family [Amycolatopsis lurida]